MSNRRQTFINLLANTSNFLVGIIINFFFTPFLIRTLGKEAYGFMPLANNFNTYISIVTAALNSMAGRFISIRFHQKKLDEANEYFNTVFFTNLFIASVLSIGMTAVVVFLDKMLNIPANIVMDIKALFAFMFISSLTSLCTSVFGVATFCKNRLDIKSSVTIAESLLRIIVLIFLFTVFKPKIYFLGLVVLLIALTDSTINYYLVKKLFPEININFKAFKKKNIGVLVGTGIWNSINQLSTILLDGLDLLIANVFLGASPMATLAIVKTIPSFIKAFNTVLATTFTPQFTILYAKGNKEEWLKEIKFSLKLLGVFVSIPISLIFVFGKEFFTLWVPGQNADLLQILSIITISSLFVSGSINTLFNIFPTTNNLKVPSLVLLCTGIANTVIVFILLNITDWGLFVIASISSILSIIRNIVFTPIYASKCIQVKYRTFYPEIIKAFLSITIIVFVLMIIKNLAVINSWITLGIPCMIGAVLGLIINAFIVLSKFERKEMIKLFARIISRKKKD